MQAYHKAVKVFKLDELSCELKEQHPLVYQQLKSCYLMSANCYLKMEQPSEAVSLMDDLLRVEPQCTRALARRAQGNYIKMDVHAAVGDLEQSLTINQNQPQIGEFYK